MNLERNVGDKDKMIRIGAGAVLTIVGLFGPKIFLLFGIVLLATGFLNYCPLYKVIGMNTASEAEKASTSADPLERASQTFDQVKQEVGHSYDKAKYEAQEAVADLKEGRMPDNIKQGAEHLVGEAKDLAGQANAKIKDVAGVAVDKTQDLAQEAKTLANEAIADVKDAANTVANKASNMAHNASQTAQNVADDAAQGVKNVADDINRKV